MIVNITQKHIDRVRQSGKWDCCSCPVALAMRDAGIESPYVSHFTLRSDGELICRTPEKVIKFIDKFDRGGKVYPFKFKVPYNMKGGVA